MKKLLISLISLILLMGFIGAADFTPQGDINLRSTYNVENAVEINSTGNITAGAYFVGDGSFLTNIVAVVNNANSSDYWDNMDTINATQMENNDGTLNILFSWLQSLFYPKAHVNLNITVANASAVYYANTTINGSMKSYTDALNITQQTWVATIFVKISELVGLVGNWSADMGNYYTSTQTDTEIQNANASAIYYANGTINDSMKSYVDAVDTNYNNTLKAYVDALDVSFNSTMKDYVDSQDTIFNNSIVAYVDVLNGSGLIRDWNSSSLIIDWNSTGYIKNWQVDITATNGTMKTYVDSQDVVFNSSMKTYVDSQDTVFNSSMKSYVDAQDHTDTTYSAGLGLNLSGTTFNHNDSSDQADSDNSGRTYIQDIFLDGYGHIISLVTGTETVVDTDTWATNFTNFFTSAEVITYINANDTTVNATMKSYVDAGDSLENSTMKSYVDATNSSMKVYVDVVDLDYNNTLKAYIDAMDNLENTTMKAYIDALDLDFNNTMKSYVDALDDSYNTTQTNYVDSKLITTFYNATSILVVTGTGQGDIAGLRSHNNSDYNVSESSSDMDFRVNFSGVDEPSQILIRYKSDTSETHNLLVSSWNYEDSDWESYLLLGESEDYVVVSSGLLDPENHVSGNLAQLRFLTTNPGGSTHKWQFDWVTVSQGTATPSSVEVDPHSVHTDGGQPLTADWNQGAFNLTNTGSWWHGLINASNITNAPWIVEETLWNANYSAFLTKVSWAEVNNGTMLNYTNALNGTLTNTTFVINTNTTMTGYVDAQEHSGVSWATVNNGTMLNYSSALNGTLSNTTFVIETNTSMKGYVDATGGGLTWAEAINGTLAELSTILGFNYYNSTDFSISDYFTKNEVLGFSYYNSTDFVVADFIASENVTYAYSLNSSGIDWATAYNGTLAKTDDANTFGVFNQTFEGDIRIGSSADNFTIFFYDTGDYNEEIRWDTSTNRFRISNDLNVKLNFVAGGTITAGQGISGTTIIASLDISTTGAGDDLWLGNPTQGSALFKAYANGSLVLKDIWSTDSIFAQGRNLSVGYDYALNMTEPLWNANYSNVSIGWLYALNATGGGISWATANNGTLLNQTDALNGTLSNTTFVISTNSSMKNYADAIFAPISEPIWTANYSAFLTHTTWAVVNNGTMLNYTNALNGTLLTSIVGDTTPQLGGYLDTNTNDIGSTSDEIENIYMATNARIYFGDGQEFSIYFNGSALISG